MAELTNEQLKEIEALWVDGRIVQRGHARQLIDSLKVARATIASFDEYARTKFTEVTTLRREYADPGFQKDYQEQLNQERQKLADPAVAEAVALHLGAEGESKAMSVPEVDVEFELKQIIKYLRIQLIAAREAHERWKTACSGYIDMLQDAKDERNAERERAAEHQSKMLDVVKIIADLEQQLATAKGDVERLDWLEAQNATSISQFGMGMAWQIHNAGERFTAPFLRAAIDAAREKENLIK